MGNLRPHKEYVLTMHALEDAAGCPNRICSSIFPNAAASTISQSGLVPMQI